MMVALLQTGCMAAGFKGKSAKPDPVAPVAPTPAPILPAPSPAPQTALNCATLRQPRFTPANEYPCPNCPRAASAASAASPNYRIDVGGPNSTWEATHAKLGIITGHEGNGLWCLDSLANQGSNEGAVAMQAGGTFASTIPLFCGAQKLRFGWINRNGLYDITYDVNRTDCDASEIRLTLSWGAQANDLELHLIRAGGRINNKDGRTDDCTWTSCVNQIPDWGVLGDAGDNPKKDIDWKQDNGLENIYLSRPEPILYHVYVEYWATGVPTAPVLQFNVRGRTTRHDLPALTTHQVWYAGTINGSTGALDLKRQIIDCTANWNAGCLMQLP